MPEQQAEVVKGMMTRRGRQHTVFFILCYLLMSFPGKAPAARPFELVLDPGHSPASPGALSCSGVPEYRYNNSLVSVVAGSLKKNQRIRVHLTKGYDSELPLRERVRDTSGKDLFISIHHDSVQPQFLMQQGAGTRRFPCSEKASGFSIFVSRSNRFFAESLAYARKLGEALVAEGLKPTLHHAEPIPGENRLLLDERLGIYAFDELVVLREGDSPALLLEAGVIVNPSEEKLIAENGFRNKVARGIQEMVKAVNPAQGQPLEQRQGRKKQVSD